MASSPKKRTGAKAGARAPEAEEGPSRSVEALLQEERGRHAQEQLLASHATIEDLAEQHAALQEQARHADREGREVAALFRAEMNAKAEALAAAQAEAAAAAAEAAAAQAAAAQREAALQAAFDSERQALLLAAAELQAKLDGLEQWQQEKEVGEKEMRRLVQENARIADEAGEKVRALQRRLYELGHGPGEDAGAEGVLGSALGGSEDGGDELTLEADLHRVLAHSRKVADEMRQYGHEAEELQREMHALESERAGLMRDAELAGEMEAQYAKRGSMQAREIRDQRSKITTLEKGLARMAQDFETEKATLEAGLRAQLADAMAEHNTLRRLLQVRTKELRQVRRLAQDVLLQRSDVEAFLVSAIQQVRGEMAAEAAAGGHAAAGTPPPPQQGDSSSSGGSGRRGESSMGRPASGVSVRWAADVRGEGAGGGGPRPSSSLSEAGEFASVIGSRSEEPSAAGSSGAAAGTAAAAAGQMDIKQLSWQDRERILRLLFAKINRAVQRPLVPAMARTQALPEVQAEAPPLPPLRGLATEAGPAGLA